MTQQPKYAPESPSKFWANGTSARPIPAGTVAQGDQAREAAAKNPPPVTLALLARGQQRFEMFCSPCHGLSGYGDGMVVQRGFPRPPSFFSQRLLAADVRHFYNVQTKGFGVMYSYADRVSEADRWAIAAYILRFKFPSTPRSPWRPKQRRRSNERRCSQPAAPARIGDLCRGGNRGHRAVYCGPA